MTEYEGFLYLDFLHAKRKLYHWASYEFEFYFIIICLNYIPYCWLQSECNDVMNTIEPCLYDTVWELF